MNTILSPLRLLCLAAVLVTGCQSKTEPPTAPEPAAEKSTAASAEEVTLTAAQVQAAGIGVGGFTRQQMADEIEANGVIDVPPQNRVSISAVMGGYVQTVKVLPGQLVKAGAVVATLRHPDYLKLQQEYLQSRAHTRFLAQELERQRILDVEDVGAKRKLQEAQADFQTEQAAQRSLAAQLKLLGIAVARLDAGAELQSTVNLITPLGGYVKSVGINPGQFVNPQDVLVEIVDRSDLHLQLNVFERDIARVQIGQSILFTVPSRGMPKEILRARVFLVGKAFDDAARTVTVHAHLEGSAADNLLPGQYVAARIQLPGAAVRTLPEEAIIQAGDVSYGYVQTRANARSATFRRVKVKSGATAHGDVAITPLETLTDTMHLVQRGAYFLEAERTKGQGDEE